MTRFFSLFFLHSCLALLAILRFSVAYRRIYPPDDKLLLEKYESLLSAAFQTFLAGRAASLQKEMNNPLKRMKARTSVADTHTHTHLHAHLHCKPAETHINIYTQYADICGQENAREKKQAHISIKILPAEAEKDAKKITVPQSFMFV